MTRPLFIVFEGIDGAGKSVQARLLTLSLDVGPGVNGTLTARAHLTREPTKALADEDGDPLVYSVTDPHAKALLFAADRRLHQACIEENLRAGVHVVCDRYSGSMISYQAAAGCDLEWLANLDTGCRVPDLMIFLHLDPAEAHRREVARGDGPAQRRDLEHVAYHQAIVLLRARGWRIEVIDGSGTVDEVHARVLEAVRGVR